ncbi:MAG: acyl-CoA thioesterase [Bacteroidales bacterium]|jgi:acyl-CoA thioester hydrolase|nr:acyl-CoA thioesterase [Bacteroidales bacterium]
MKIDTQEIVFKNKKEIQIRMTDLDPFGHVNNGVIYSYYDVGRLHYLTELGETVEWESLDKVIVHTACDFLESIRFHDSIRVESKIIGIGNKSVKLIQRIIDINTGKIKSVCYSVMSGYDRATDSSKVISSEFKRKVEKYEGLGG